MYFDTWFIMYNQKKFWWKSQALTFSSDFFFFLHRLKFQFLETFLVNSMVSFFFFFLVFIDKAWRWTLHLYFSWRISIDKLYCYIFSNMRRCNMLIQKGIPNIILQQISTTVECFYFCLFFSPFFLFSFLCGLRNKSHFEYFLCFLQ